MTGLLYYTLAYVSTRKAGSLVALRQHLKSKAIGKRKYYCMTVQLDEMIRELYPTSGKAAIDAVMAVIAPELGSDKKADFSLFNAKFKAKYAPKYKTQTMYMEQHFALEADFTTQIPLMGYLFVPKEDTVADATTTYMVGLYIMFLELVFFKSVVQLMDEFDTRGYYALDSKALLDISAPGDKMGKDDEGNPVLRPAPLYRELGRANTTGILPTYLRQSLIMKGAGFGTTIHLVGADKTFIQVDIDKGHTIDKTDLLKKLISLYSKIIS
jgi:hypothetical protein